MWPIEIRDGMAYLAPKVIVTITNGNKINYCNGNGEGCNTYKSKQHILGEKTIELSNMSEDLYRLHEVTCSPHCATARRSSDL